MDIIIIITLLKRLRDDFFYINLWTIRKYFVNLHQQIKTNYETDCFFFAVGVITVYNGN